MPKKRERPLLQHMEVGDNAPAYHPAPEGDSPDRPVAPVSNSGPRYTPPINHPTHGTEVCPRLSPEGASKGQDHSPPSDSKPTSPTSPTVWKQIMICCVVYHTVPAKLMKTGSRYSYVANEIFFSGSGCVLTEEPF